MQLARYQLLEVITNAKKLIKDPKHWTKGVMSRDTNGTLCSITSPDATQFCMLGAISKAYNDLYDDIEYKSGTYTTVRKQFSQYTGVDALIYINAVFNDKAKTTHADILAMFDEIIRIIKNE